MHIEVKVHPQAQFDWKPINDLVPLLGLKAMKDAGNGLQVDEPLHGLMFTDPDGEIHVFAFTDDARVTLVEKLTGGIMIVDQVPKH